MPLLYDPDALADVPQQDIDRIYEKTGWLWHNQRAIRHLRLSSHLTPFYKRRVGKYRIIYTFEPGNDEDRMVVRLVAPRDTVYQRL